MISTIISFHGVDGVGKTSLMTLLEHSGMLPDAVYIRKENKDSARLVERYCRRVWGDSRDWLSGPFASSVAIASAFDFLAHFHAHIEPHLGCRRYIVCDRYSLCYAAYIHATGASFPVSELLAKVPVPDISVLVQANIGLLPQRYRARGGASEDEFPELMRVFQESYDELFPRWTKNCVRLANDGALSAAFEALQRALQKMLPAEREAVVSK